VAKPAAPRPKPAAPLPSAAPLPKFKPLLEMTWRAASPSSVEMPERRPVHKAKRFFVDPELYEQWEREEEARLTASRSWTSGFPGR
jgi:hypothetical protein